MAKVVKHSPAPFYFAAAVWLVWGLMLPLYRWSDFLITAAVSAAAGFAGGKLFPDRAYETPDPPKPETTGNAELDALVSERDRAISEMKRLNIAIEDPTISAQIEHLGSVTRKIVAQVIQHPDKLPQISKFMNYYLPTTLKILNAYDRMDAVGISGDNIDSTKKKVEKMMTTAVTAFDRQLDALFGDEALDISTDITVMENLLAQEGLSGPHPFSSGG